ncbi:MAG: response regulator, partial [Pseudomonadota bacterium]
HEVSSEHRSINRQEEAQSAINKLRGARVLLVEDNEINQELAMELLLSNGVSVAVANDGQEALNMLDKEYFDGVLMDCQMPVMDGYEATRQLRRQECFKDLPILAMTANAMLGDKEKALQAGMNAHIAKPINVRDMFTTMASWIKPSNPDREISSSLDDTIYDSPLSEHSLPELKGIDTTAGLATCQNNHKLYRKLLIKFKQSETDFSEQFKQAQAIDGSKATTRCVHSLKGVAGNIGAKDVQYTAQRLELACHEHQSAEVIGPLLDEVVYSLSIVLESLEAIKEPTAKLAVEDEALDTEKLKSLLMQLRELLEDDDADAADVVEEIEALPGIASQRIILKRLLKAIDNYDFDLALDELAKLEIG